MVSEIYGVKTTSYSKGTSLRINACFDAFPDLLFALDLRFDGCDGRRGVRDCEAPHARGRADAQRQRHGDECLVNSGDSLASCGLAVQVTSLSTTSNPSVRVR